MEVYIVNLEFATEVITKVKYLLQRRQNPYFSNMSELCGHCDVIVASAKTQDNKFWTGLHVITYVQNFVIIYLKANELQGDREFPTSTCSLPPA